MFNSCFFGDTPSGTKSNALPIGDGFESLPFTGFLVITLPNFVDDILPRVFPLEPINHPPESYLRKTKDYMLLQVSPVTNRVLLSSAYFFFCSLLAVLRDLY